MCCVIIAALSLFRFRFCFGFFFVSSQQTDRKGLLKRLKDFIGSDLTRVTIPVWFNEPTCVLQYFLGR